MTASVLLINRVPAREVSWTHTSWRLSVVVIFRRGVELLQNVLEFREDLKCAAPKPSSAKRNLHVINFKFRPKALQLLFSSFSTRICTDVSNQFHLHLINIFL